MAKYPKIDGYLIDSVLGVGGMGQVFKAKQISMDRYVAIKVIPNTTENESYIKRFEKEAKSVAKLNHPNIVRGIDHGKNDEVCYFVMEFIEGVNLQSSLEQQTFSEKKALEIVLQISQALNHAYKNDIIHRDIKPDNIMITPDKRVLLCDLGLAKSTSHNTTVSGGMMGTPHYMSPEQCRGEKEVDTRSDIYNLGITLFHMITGHVPFDAPHAAAVCMKHISSEMPDPRDSKNVSAATVALINKMTAKKTSDRFQNPQELMTHIQDILDGKIVAPKVNISKNRTRKVQTRRLKRDRLDRLTSSRDAKERNKSFSSSSTSRLANQRAKRSNNNNFLVIAVGIVLGLVAFTLFISSGNNVDVDALYDEIVTLLNEDKWGDAFGKAKHYNDVISDEKLRHIEEQMSLFEKHRASILVQLTEQNYSHAHVLATQVKDKVDHEAIIPYVSKLSVHVNSLQSDTLDGFEKKVPELSEFELQSLIEEIERISFSPRHVRRQQELIAAIQRQIAANNEEAQSKKESPKNEWEEIKNVEPRNENKEEREEKTLDPEQEKLITQLTKINELISAGDMDKALDILEKSQSLIQKFSSENVLYLELAKIDESIKKYFTKILEEQGLAGVEKILGLYVRMVPFIEEEILGKQSFINDEMKKLKDEILNTSFAQAPDNSDLSTFMELLNFLRDHRDALEDLDEAWIDTTRKAFERFVNYSRRHRGQHWEKLLDHHASVFAIEIDDEDIKDLEEDNKEHLHDHMTKVLGNLSRQHKYKRVQNVCQKTKTVFNDEELNAYYDEKRNEARIRELMELQSNNNSFFYNFERNPDGAKDWVLMRIKGKRITSNKAASKFPAVGGGYILLWKFPVTEEFEVDVEIWNPVNRRTRRRNLSAGRWPNSFGIIGLSGKESQLMYLVHPKTIEIGTVNSKFGGFKLIRRLRKKFPRGDVNPQTIFFKAKTNPLDFHIRQKNIQLEDEGYELNKDFYIGIVNLKSRYPLIIKSIRIQNAHFYTEKYLEKEHFKF
ncbi:serine/threonine protein kinase [Candidatus Uabimicrobium amorphum]|uniref:Serine/threonine protein kinase n=1 Tax=Uabimicrobium amorphum TaxID=2596890 RepID=A0A5S9F186_UABAM|nr:serine/threonine-protein kinase [Candidatus Uabimicrobium amorphum]BBM81843.1 serine/threonine protein kinase [Candidatus Uabimicrobium amorphum]